MTPTPPAAVTTGSVWVRRQPDLDAPLEMVLPANSALVIHAVYGPWTLVEWFDAPPMPSTGVRRGWVTSEWVRANTPIPDEIITPFPGDGV
jgi:hypothetical protein